MELRVPGVVELEHGQARKFEFEREGQRQEGFILREERRFPALVDGSYDRAPCLEEARP